MSEHRHRQAKPLLNLKSRTALILAPILTLVPIVIGVSGTSAAPNSSTPAPETLIARNAELAVYSRSSARISALPKAPAPVRTFGVAKTVYAATDLPVLAQPKASAKILLNLSQGETLQQTGQNHAGFVEVLANGKYGWVAAEAVETERSLGGPSCPASAVESGLTGNAIIVFRTVCNNFPQIARYGGRDPHGEHADGRAIDIMTSDYELGTQIAEFLRANAAELKVRHLIWRQRISAYGGSWRGMSNRGSATANHFDHVHVSVQ